MRHNAAFGKWKFQVIKQNSGILLEIHITKFVVSFSKFKGHESSPF
jgi:hypothetical protein